MDNKKIMIGVVATLVISIIGLGIAFAAFSRNLVIGGNASVVASTWDIVFEGVTNTNTIDDPVLTGTANEVVHPSIGSNGTSIGNYSVTLTTPGDSVTYNFKVHNKGDYAGSVTSIVMNSGVNLTTDTSKRTSEANTLGEMDYKLYYTDNNELVGQSAKDCLEPGESENVTLKIVFSSTDATNTNVLPSSDLLLDNLGVTVNYTQTTNCPLEAAGETANNSSFTNIDGSYYTYEGKSFIGTGVNNVIISEDTIGKAEHALFGCSDGTEYSNIDDYEEDFYFNRKCDSGAEYISVSTPAADMASAYCSGCRLMTLSEAGAWAGCTESQIENWECNNSKLCIINENHNWCKSWWLSDNYWGVDTLSYITTDYIADYDEYVRPVVSISNASMSGSGTKASPYVITVSN